MNGIHVGTINYILDLIAVSLTVGIGVKGIMLLIALLALPWKRQ